VCARTHDQRQDGGRVTQVIASSEKYSYFPRTLWVQYTPAKTLRARRLVPGCPQADVLYRASPHQQGFVSRAETATSLARSAGAAPKV